MKTKKLTLFYPCYNSNKNNKKNNKNPHQNLTEGSLGKVKNQIYWISTSVWNTSPVAKGALAHCMQCSTNWNTSPGFFLTTCSDHEEITVICKSWWKITSRSSHDKLSDHKSRKNHGKITEKSRRNHEEIMVTISSPVNFRLNKFFDPRSSSIRKCCCRENKRKRKRRKVEKNGENSSPLTLLTNGLNSDWLQRRRAPADHLGAPSDYPG